MDDELTPNGISEEARSHLSGQAPYPHSFLYPFLFFLLVSFAPQDHLTHLTFSLHWSINNRVQAKVTVGLYQAALTKPASTPQMSLCTPTATLQSSWNLHHKGLQLQLKYSSCIQNILLPFHVLFCMPVSHCWDSVLMDAVKCCCSGMSFIV